MSVSVRTLFFAAYRDLLGTSELDVALEGQPTVGDLVRSLRARGAPFDGLPEHPAVAVNHAYADASEPLSSGDEVAFIPRSPEGEGVIRASVQTEPIRPEAVLDHVGCDEDGAALLFLGVVRNHADGRSVRGMHYDAYEAMAEAVLREIATEASEQLGTDRVSVVHRTGDLDVGEVSVAIAVSSPHRAEAYEVSRYVIEEIKKRLPVWKREHYVDGDDAWVEGTVPPGTGGAPGRVTGGRDDEPATAARGGRP